VHCEASKKTKAKKTEKKNKRGRRAMACSNLYAHGVASCRSRTNEFITTTVPKTIYIFYFIYLKPFIVEFPYGNHHPPMAGFFGLAYQGKDIVFTFIHHRVYIVAIGILAP
jgi:hypothetical protein